LAGCAVALAAPLLGAIADSAGMRKQFLAAFSLLGICATAGLFLVQSGFWFYAAGLYVFATIGFSGANIFYDALLPVVADRGQRERVSARGYALGYLGGGLLLALCIWMTLRPAAFGITGPAPEILAIKISFLLTAVWWLLFTLPVLAGVPESLTPGVAGASRPVRAGLRRIAATFRDIRSLKPVWLFLLAYWFYIDGVDTVIRMAVDYGLSLGFPSRALIVALLLTQFVGFPSALVFGRLGQRWGSRPAILLGLGCYVVIVLWASMMRSEREFYLLAVLVGMVQGGVQALSRSFFSRLIPLGREAEFFGFYNMIGKYAVIFGPALMGLTGWLLGSSRAGIVSLGVFFVVGGLLLFRVSPSE
jgi:MFS transporter, UMF1 family